MGAMIWCLFGLLSLGVAGVVWAVLTGGPAGPPRPVRHTRIPQHSRPLAEDRTRRLGPRPPVDWSQLPPLPDSPVQPLLPLDKDYPEREFPD
jgi:hypothetical protein